MNWLFSYSLPLQKGSLMARFSLYQHAKKIHAAFKIFLSDFQDYLNFHYLYLSIC